MSKEDLNAVSSQYKPNAVTEIENDLILHWYPKRILSRFNHADSLLELGLGHGYTAELFSKATNNHVIVDGASSVIDQFKKKHPSFSVEWVLDYFKTFKRVGCLKPGKQLKKKKMRLASPTPGRPTRCPR